MNNTIYLIPYDKLNLLIRLLFQMFGCDKLNDTQYVVCCVEIDRYYLLLCSIIRLLKYP